MLVPNREVACHHIELQDGCPWCQVYEHQSVRECDRCQAPAHTDAIYLSTTGARPQLICVGCHMWETNGGPNETR